MRQVYVYPFNKIVSLYDNIRKITHYISFPSQWAPIIKSSSFSYRTQVVLIAPSLGKCQIWWRTLALLAFLPSHDGYLQIFKIPKFASFAQHFQSTHDEGTSSDFQIPLFAAFAKLFKAFFCCQPIMDISSDFQDPTISSVWKQISNIFVGINQCTTC